MQKTSNSVQDTLITQPAKKQTIPPSNEFSEIASFDRIDTSLVEASMGNKSIEGRQLGDTADQKPGRSNRFKGILSTLIGSMFFSLMVVL